VQDIGVLALIQQLGPSYAKLLERVQSFGGSLIDCELDTLGFDHLVLSARLLTHWGLPGALCAAISVPPVKERIEELSGSERTLPRILHLAELVARMIDQPYGGALRELLDVGEGYCHLTYEKLEPIVAALQSKVGDLAEVLSLQLPDGQGYVDLLIAAQSRLADETVTVAAAMVSPDAEVDLLALASDLRREVAKANRREPTRDIQGKQPPPHMAQHAPAYQTIAPHTANHLPAFASGSQRGTATEISCDRVLTAHLSSAVQRSRNTRRPLTLALFEIDRFGDLLVQAGPVGTMEIAQSLRCALADWANQQEEAILISDSRLAMVWQECSRSDAVQLARDCLVSARDWSRGRFQLCCDLSLSAGLATLEVAPKNYPCQELIDAAGRCLNGAQLSGGDTVKSIAF
jgi:GGDEF domain-containing protein